MPNFIRHIVSGALLGAVIGALAFFFLAEGMVEGLIGGVIIGGSVGAQGSEIARARERDHMGAPSGLQYLDSKIRDD